MILDKDLTISNQKQNIKRLESDILILNKDVEYEKERSSHLKEENFQVTQRLE